MTTKPKQQQNKKVNKNTPKIIPVKTSTTIKKNHPLRYHLLNTDIKPKTKTKK